MSHVLGARLKDGRNIAEVILAPLLSKNIGLTVIDAGARNGIHPDFIPDSYAREATVIGFEPNLDEYNKLVTKSTDAQKVGLSMSQFKHERYINCALWDQKEQRPFFITKGAGACTLMGEASQSVTSRMWLTNDDRPYSELHTEVRKTTPVDCDRLDQVLDSDQVVDILKVDVEGGELAVFQGAEKLLNNGNILFIKTEFVFNPYYENHPVLGHQHVYLHEHGFRLIDLDFDQARYSRSPTSIPPSADRRMAYAGDAYFVLDPERVSLTPDKLHRAGVASMVLGFSSLGLSFMRDAGLVTEMDLLAVEAAVGKHWTNRRMRFVWNQIPVKIKTLFR